MDKIDETLNAYRSREGTWDAKLRRFGRIASTIPPRARDILNMAKYGLISAELNLYDLLTEQGVEPLQAAKAAISYPDTHQFLRSGSEYYQMYRRLRNNGDSPLPALLKMAESEDAKSHRQSVTENEYMRRLEVFRSVIGEILTE